MAERVVAVVGYDGAELLDIACLTTSLAMANVTGAVRVPYRAVLLSPGGRPIACGTGLTLQSQSALERFTGPLDTVVVSGGVGHRAAADDARLVGHVRRLARESKRVASVCTGASVLAAAGLLDGKRATTHWRFARSLAARHPAVKVDPDPIYIREGRIATAAGVTSALDLALAFVAEDHGAGLAREVARELVVYLQRPGTQAQMSVFTAAPAPAHDLVRKVVEHITEHIGDELETAALAEVAGVSPRHLTRLFVAELASTPGRYVRNARTEAAAQLLVGTPLTMPAVASRCGFSSAEALRQAFVARYGIPPSRYRAAHRER